MRIGLWGSLVGLVLGCAPGDEPVRTNGPASGTHLTVTDEGKPSGYQELWFGHYNRGRGNVVADYDGDGDPDLFSGNPGGESFLIRNLSTPGKLAFEPWQVLSDHELFYGGVAADFDNDGDPDLFVATGANDGYEADRIYRNDGGDEPLVDVSDVVDVLPTSPGGIDVPNGSMGARAFDVDLDGDLDLWVSNFGVGGSGPADEMLGLNQLYVNEGGLALVDRALELGLDQQAASRHSAILDFDNDGDPDIYENNFDGRSVLWRNRLVEDGVLGFENVTEAMGLGDTRLGGSAGRQAMCALPGDFDNDGWEDIAVLNRGREGAETLDHHHLFMNQQGAGFVDVGDRSELSDDFGAHEQVTTSGPMGDGWGVMGCQIGDVNLDGFPDLFLGNGVGAAGGRNRLFLSRERTITTVDGVGDVVLPRFDDWSDALDFPADPIAGAPDVPYPYRTHGSAFADYDGDGIPELGVHNGGPAEFDFREPNRLWVFHHADARFVRVRLVGDGVSVNRDGAGARVQVTVARDADGATWTLHQTRRLGSGFGAQNEAELTFGLGDGDRVIGLVVRWPDGTEDEPPLPDGTAATVVVGR